MEETTKIENKLTLKKKIIQFIQLLLLIIFLIPIIIVTIIIEIKYRVEFQNLVLRTKKRVILVYSESPNWHDYIENNFIPLFKEKEIILNWSQRKEWDNSKWEIKAFHHWGGSRNYNPIIIIFENLFRVHVYKLLPAFIEYKHGKENKIKSIEKEIYRVVSGLP